MGATLEQCLLVLVLVIVGVVGAVAIVGMVTITALTVPATYAPEAVVPEAVVAPTAPTKTEADPLGPGTLFMAAATIMAFAAFGSTLSMKMRPRPKMRVRIGLSCIVIVVLIQALFMLCLVEDKCPPPFFGVSIVGWWAFATAFFILSGPFLIIIGSDNLGGKRRQSDTSKPR